MSSILIVLQPLIQQLLQVGRSLPQRLKPVQASARRWITPASSGLVVVVGITAAPIFGQTTQCPAEWVRGVGSPGLNGSGVMGEVNAVAQAENGDLFLGGEFSVGYVYSYNNFARVAHSTAMASAVGRGIGGPIYALATLLNGDIIVCGDFPFVGGQQGGLYVNHIAKYSPVTNEWSVFAFATEPVRAICVANSGDVYFASHRQVYRVSSANSEQATLGEVASGQIRSLCILPSGSLVIGGSFSSVSGVGAQGVARLDVSSMTWSAVDLGVNGVVNALTPLPNGNFAAAGEFSFAGGGPSNRIAEHNEATGQWSSLGAGIDGGESSVNSLAVSEGHLVVGGSFNAAGGIAASNLADYDLTTGDWHSLGAGTDGPVRALQPLSGGSVVVCGNFYNAGGSSRRSVAKLHVASRSWSDAAHAVNPSPAAMALLPDDKVVVAGGFASAGGLATNRVAVFDLITKAWSALGEGTNGNVYSVGVLPSGDIIAGGTFSLAGSVPAQNIALFSRSTQQWSALGAGLPGAVQAISILPDGDVFAGGHFQSGEGPLHYLTARYDFGTGQWTPADSPGPSGWVTCMAPLPSGQVVVGGGYDSIGGIQTECIALFDPGTWQWSPLPSGLSPYVYRIIVAGNGDILTAGYSGLKRYSFSTSSWTTLSPPVITPVTVAELADGTIAVSDQTLPYYPTDLNSLWSLSPGDTTWARLGTGISGNAWALLPIHGSELLIAGAFDTAGGEQVGGFAWYSFGRRGPTLLAQPHSQVACPSGTATFSVAAADPAPITYQWQWSHAAETAGTWLSVSDGINDDQGAVHRFTATGALSPTLVIAPPVPGLPFSDIDAPTPVYFRCAIANANCSVCSSAVALTFGTYADLGTQGGEPGHDGVYDNNDFILFIGYFFTRSSRADCGTTGGLLGSDGRFDNNDFIAFINLFFQGC